MCLGTRLNLPLPRIHVYTKWRKYSCTMQSLVYNCLPTSCFFLRDTHHVCWLVFFFYEEYLHIYSSHMYLYTLVVFRINSLDTTGNPYLLEEAWTKFLQPSLWILEDWHIQGWLTAALYGFKCVWLFTADIQLSIFSPLTCPCRGILLSPITACMNIWSLWSTYHVSTWLEFNSEVSACGEVLDTDSLSPREWLSTARVALPLKLPVAVWRGGWSLEDVTSLAAVNCSVSQMSA